MHALVAQPINTLAWGGGDAHAFPWWLLSLLRRLMAGLRAAIAQVVAHAAAAAASGGGADHQTWISFQAGLLKRMVAFMGPAMLIPLGDPLMTLVDTVCIGQVTSNLLVELSCEAD